MIQKLVAGLGTGIRERGENWLEVETSQRGLECALFRAVLLRCSGPASQGASLATAMSKVVAALEMGSSYKGDERTYENGHEIFRSFMLALFFSFSQMLKSWDTLS